MSIKENIGRIRERIIKSASKAGRDPDSIKLLGVSKQIPIELMVEAYRGGLLDFGENYAQEFRDKYVALSPEMSDAKWHFIGHLQKNKIKYVIGKVDLIHSLDSVELAAEINRRSENLGTKTNILVEINSGDEQTKTGISYGEAQNLINELNEFENISFKGLMTMAPYFDDPELARPYFRKLKSFSDDIIKNHPEATEISMGMSDDFEVAVEEGSTILRIGTAIFGPRKK